MSYGMDGWNHDNDLVRRKDVMDSIVREYNRSRTGDGLKLAWIEKAVNEVPFAQPTQNTRVNSNNALDTISRAEAIDALSCCQTYLFDTRDTDRKISLEDAEYVIEKLPSAQPEIIRCKDCKHSEHWYRDKSRCFLWHEEGIDVFKDGFCNYAERRTDEHT